MAESSSPFLFSGPRLVPWELSSPILFSEPRSLVGIVSAIRSGAHPVSKGGDETGGDDD